jgi:hypothetical protein
VKDELSRCWVSLDESEMTDRRGTGTDWHPSRLRAIAARRLSNSRRSCEPVTGRSDVRGILCQVADPESMLIQLAKVLDPSLPTAQSIACLPEMVRTRLKVCQPRAARTRARIAWIICGSKAG